MRTFVRRLIISAPIWLLLAAIGLGQYYVSFNAEGGAVSRGPRVVDLFAADYVFWWLATPMVMLLVERFPFDGIRRGTSVVVHALAACFFALFPELVRVTTMFLLVQPERGNIWWLYSHQLRNRYRFEIVTYIAICAVVATIEMARRSRSRELQAARLETELAQARLRTLSAQLHPHFLFNALNSIAMLIRDGAHNDALRTVVAYGELLRGVLQTAASEIPLRDEIAFIRRYLEIEQTRFPDFLSATIDLPRDVEGALVPSFVLQPIVENALHHAFAGREQARLSVSAVRRGEVLRLEVVDDGSGLPADWSPERSSGVGLRNTRLRLAECYGSAQRMELRAAANGGTSVVLEMPFHVDAVTPAAALDA